jgi:hypothetical protein
MDFNKRDLTFSRDVLAAFAGITTVLSRVFYGGFRYAFPGMFFDAGLLWQPCTYTPPLKRIEAESSGNIISELPSWSWTGLQENLY